jgi:sugar lactone lactonase YvrE
MAEAVRLLLDARAELGEGAIWDAERKLLYWVDILGQSVHIYDPESRRNRSLAVGQFVGTVVPRVSGGLALALQHGFAHLDPESGKLTMLQALEAEPPEHRFNDGKCDPVGRFWAGTMHLEAEAGAGTLYMLDTDGSLHPVLRGVSVSNGITWSRDGRTMYYIDSPTFELAAFDYEPRTGMVANRRVAITFPAAMGYPDGSTMDAEGMIWVAMCGGGRVTRWDPTTGRLLREIALPVTLVTSCAFGGPGLQRMYVTSARTGLDERALQSQPLAGGLFEVTAGTSGVPASAYRG